ncbi:hypothetical protein SAMN04488056_111181 [Cohaesibacter marisflavi]|uniref:Uncharacterized protein n=1 Tax=Cohaesibacter marisflavi TaxID=655353 RepID=A0A1I5JI98_9HYPH|nr:hypothetical protein [Cohaesibacter marisflavi]SFO72537.1 hypothetical protein SAMN04488056_111181 [Cohaesibacter marisflavi]
MGRSSYSGGSTIVKLGRTGTNWGGESSEFHIAKNAIEKKTKYSVTVCMKLKRVEKKKSFKGYMSWYMKNCAKAHFEGKSFPVIDKHYQSLFPRRADEINQFILNSVIFQKALRKLIPTPPQKAPTSKRGMRTRVRNAEKKFAERCARCDFFGDKYPKLQSVLKENLTDHQQTRFVETIKQHPNYKLRMKALKKDPPIRAPNKVEREKMLSKLIVEKKKH